MTPCPILATFAKRRTVRARMTKAAGVKAALTRGQKRSCRSLCVPWDGHVCTALIVSPCLTAALLRSPWAGCAHQGRGFDYAASSWSQAAAGRATFPAFRLLSRAMLCGGVRAQHTWLVPEGA